MERRLVPAAPVPASSGSSIFTHSSPNPGISNAIPSSNLASSESVRRDDPNQAQVSSAAVGQSNAHSKRRGDNNKKEGESEGTGTGAGAGGDEEDPSATKKKAKRRKVDHAIKREIGHLCHDEVKPSQRDLRDPSATPSNNNASAPSIPRPNIQDSYPIQSTDNNSQLSYNMQSLTAPPASTPGSNWPIISQAAFPYASQNAGNEFSVLTDFLQSLDDRSFFGTPQNIFPPPAPPDIPTPSSIPNQVIHPQLQQQQQQQQPQQQVPLPHHHQSQPQSHPPPPPQHPPQIPQQPISQPPAQPPQPPASPILPAATKTEQFLLTAADQAPGSRDERLSRVIHSKYEAGLLKPYNYVKGYARLSRWMDRNVSQESKQQILGPLSVLRPKFRAIAQSLTDMDLVFIEEAFERLLLDYDRVFSAMGIPACLWRRTGEIYKGNREFAELVGVEGYMLREGRLCIYELMAEESAVNYWEKYGHVAFDTGQKAVLTSCVLRYKPKLSMIVGGTGNTGASSTQNSPLALRPTNPGSNYGTSGRRGNEPTEQGIINCCFSFTIRRDTWGIPSMIIGNFIRH
ncbi:hypothetical protein Clacol_008921 [Clathrus columnatus]|uniref:ERT1/acuK family PAS domain-containing protein n=1 Tax=Clathrus columnatus TaxID=1419009 RepID=A0AAV5AJU3_9AGAM|nr:hypothetical protein Clacol_008921 [Clathrus columnatus]